MKSLIILGLLTACATQEQVNNLSSQIDINTANIIALSCSSRANFCLSNVLWQMNNEQVAQRDYQAQITACLVAGQQCINEVSSEYQRTHTTVETASPNKVGGRK